MVTHEENILYCSCCVSANEHVTQCCECGKNIRTKKSAFLHFLIKHTAEKFKGDLEDGVFDTIKNFILSHLYGSVVSVAVITSVVALIYGTTMPSYVTKVWGGVNRISDSGPAITEMSRELYDKLRDLHGDYSMLCDRKHGMPYVVNTNKKAEDFIAQNTGKFHIDGVHQVMDTGVCALMERHEDGRVPGTRSYFGDLYVNEQLTNPLAITLRDSGYKVTEGVCRYVGYKVCEKNENGGYIVPKPDEVPPDDEFYVQYVYVEIDGEWYIAEERFVEGENP